MPILDFNKEFKDNPRLIQVVDKDFLTYKPRVESDGVVHVEKCLARKDQYINTELGTKKSDRNAYLVKETNKQPVGGGLMTFERHYATIPDTWYDYELISYRVLWDGRVNYRNNFNGSGSSWDRTRKSIARAERRYFLESENVFGIPVLPTQAVSDRDDNAGTNFVDDFTKIYTVPPESRNAGSNFKRVIAPDRVQVYMGNIYELTRFTIVL
jgi:hypothetical protein